MLGSGFAKLGGAKERLGKLEGEMQRGAVTDLLGIGTQRDPQGRVLILVDRHTSIPAEWHIWIGECVHNIRSALDHLAYALNVAGSRLDPPPNARRSQFPLYVEPDQFAAMKSMGDRKRCMMGFFPEGAAALAERLQPYHAGDHSDDSETAQWLGVLAELSNIDKHRRFPLTGVYPDLVTHPREVEGHAVTEVENFHVSLKVGTPILRLTVPTLPPSVEDPKVDFGYMGGLNFEGVEADPPLPLILDQEPVDFVLPSLLEAVREKVFPAFQPFLE